jgi:hypothetical protein
MAKLSALSFSLHDQANASVGEAGIHRVDLARFHWLTKGTYYD